MKAVKALTPKEIEENQEMLKEMAYDIIIDRETKRIQAGDAELTNIYDRFGITEAEIAKKTGLTCFTIPDLVEAKKILTSLVKDGKIVSYGEERLEEKNSDWLPTYGTQEHIEIIEPLRA